MAGVVQRAQRRTRFSLTYGSWEHTGRAFGENTCSQSHVALLLFVTPQGLYSSLLHLSTLVPLEMVQLNPRGTSGNFKLVRQMSTWIQGVICVSLDQRVLIPHASNLTLQMAPSPSCACLQSLPEQYRPPALLQRDVSEYKTTVLMISKTLRWKSLWLTLPWYSHSLTGVERRQPEGI